MNHVEISGRLTRDPEIRYVGQRDPRFPICTLNVAVDDADSRYNRDTQKREVGSGFYKVEVVGEYGVMIHSQLAKGDEVHVVGSLSQFTVGGRNGGEKETKTQIRAKVVTPLVNTTGATHEEMAPPLTPPTDDGPDGWDEEPF